jgi:hypothetical protein
VPGAGSRREYKVTPKSELVSLHLFDPCHLASLESQESKVIENLPFHGEIFVQMRDRISDG